MVTDSVVPIPAAAKVNIALNDIVTLAKDALPPAVPSPSGSSAGWLFSTWLAKNKNMLKQGVSYITAAFTALIGLIHVVPAGQGGAWAVILTGFVGVATVAVQLASRFVLDWIDYRYSDSPK